MGIFMVGNYGWLEAIKVMRGSQGKSILFDPGLDYNYMRMREIAVDGEA